jgi:hypothetical protein
MDLKTRQWTESLTNFQSAQQLSVAGQEKQWNDFWSHFLQSRLGIAAVASFCSFLFLLILQPPMVRQKTKEPWMVGDLDLMKLMSWTFVVFIGTLIIPYFLE